MNSYLDEQQVEELVNFDFIEEELFDEDDNNKTFEAFLNSNWDF
jgi:hypothetical protein